MVLIYDLCPNWPFERSPKIETKGNARARDNKEGTASASIDEGCAEVLNGLKKYHCIPVGESYPFVTVEFAEYLQPYVDGDVLFRPAEIFYKDKIVVNCYQFYVVTEFDCVEAGSSLFNENGTVAYAKFREDIRQGCWVSNMPYTKNVVQICSQDFFDLIMKSKFSRNSFEFSFACLPFVSYATEYFGKEICRLLAEKLNDPDYQKNPFLMRKKRPELFEVITKAGRLPREHISWAAERNLSKDEYLAYLFKQTLLMIGDKNNN